MVFSLPCPLLQGVTAVSVVFLGLSWHAVTCSHLDFIRFPWKFLAKTKDMDEVQRLLMRAIRVHTTVQLV